MPDVGELVPREGLRWRRIVVDGLNLLKTSQGKKKSAVDDVFLLGNFVEDMCSCGVDFPHIKIVLPQRFCENLLSAEQKPEVRADALFLLRYGTIVESPSWCYPSNSIDDLYESTLHRSTGKDDMWKINDDLVAIFVAWRMNAVLVSNDMYKDAKKYVSKQSYPKLLSYLLKNQIHARASWNEERSKYDWSFQARGRDNDVAAIVHTGAAPWSSTD